MIELYMTDLCDEPDAEARCESALTRALAIDESSAEAWLGCARLRSVQERRDDAVAALSRVAALDESLPLAARMAAARLALELEAWREGAQLLDGVLEEDDEVYEAWFLLGEALDALGEASESLGVLAVADARLSLTLGEMRPMAAERLPPLLDAAASGAPHDAAELALALACQSLAPDMLGRTMQREDRAELLAARTRMRELFDAVRARTAAAPTFLRLLQANEVEDDADDAIVPQQ
jgi:hypothetical protein